MAPRDGRRGGVCVCRSWLIWLLLVENMFSIGDEIDCRTLAKRDLRCDAEEEAAEDLARSNERGRSEFGGCSVETVKPEEGKVPSGTMGIGLDIGASCLGGREVGVELGDKEPSIEKRCLFRLSGVVGLLVALSDSRLLRLLRCSISGLLGFAAETSGVWRGKNLDNLDITDCLLGIGEAVIFVIGASGSGILIISSTFKSSRSSCSYSTSLCVLPRVVPP